MQRVAADRVEPRPQGRLAAPRIERPVGPQERLLGDVLGFVCIAELADGEPPDGVAVAGHQAGERLFVGRDRCHRGLALLAHRPHSHGQSALRHAPFDGVEGPNNDALGEFSA